jgi:hypothetical protein
MQVLVRLDPNDERARTRVESPQYQGLVRFAFHNWRWGEEAEKRELIQNILYSAAVDPLPNDDLFKLFLQWVSRYTLLHFRVIRVLKDHPGATRLQIWQAMGGQPIRDDAAEADVFASLIRELSIIAHLIRQQRTFDRRTGRAHKREPTRKREASRFMVSSTDSREPNELTAAGVLFVRNAMGAMAPLLNMSQPVNIPAAVA